MIENYKLFIFDEIVLNKKNRKNRSLRDNTLKHEVIKGDTLYSISKKYNISSVSGDYKDTANKVLLKLNQLGYKVSELDRYLKRKTLINQKNADEYIKKLLKEKNNQPHKNPTTSLKL